MTVSGLTMTSVVRQPIHNRESQTQRTRVSATETELMVAVGTLQDQGLMTESKNLGLQSSTGSETISQGGK